jgi:tetratricopeptide (TPR) repeat protein
VYDRPAVRGALAFVLPFFLALSVARADEPVSAERTAKARRLYNEGEAAYKAGRYDEAVERYTAAHELVPRPFFLFNIAQAHRLGGDKAKALFYYKAFLAASPGAFNAEEVRGRIQELESELAPASSPVVPPVEVAKAVEPAPAPALAPPPSADATEAPPIYKRWWFWAGVGAVAVATTAIVVVSASGHGAPSTDLGTTNIFAWHP